MLGDINNDVILGNDIMTIFLLNLMRCAITISGEQVMLQYGKNLAGRVILDEGTTLSEHSPFITKAVITRLLLYNTGYNTSVSTGQGISSWSQS